MVRITLDGIFVTRRGFCTLCLIGPAGVLGQKAHPPASSSFCCHVSGNSSLISTKSSFFCDFGGTNSSPSPIAQLSSLQMTELGVYVPLHVLSLMPSPVKQLGWGRSQRRPMGYTDLQSVISIISPVICQNVQRNLEFKLL